MIATVGILVVLLLPAILTAMRNLYKNKLKQLALGWMNDKPATGHFPTGGWSVTQLPPAEAGGFESFVSYRLKVLHSRGRDFVYTKK